MGWRLLVALVSCLVSYCSGLHLSLDLGGTHHPTGVRSPCAVLSCTEDYSDPQAQHSSLSINEIHLFTTSSASENSEGKQLLASLTLQQPNTTRVSNGMRVDGSLEPSRASLRLEMFKSVNCAADFVCEVVSLDSHGNRVVSSNQLRQQGARSRVQGGEAVLSSGQSSQFMMFVQQLAMLENRLEGRMQSIEEKIENRVADKLCEIEAKLSKQAQAFDAGAEDTSGVTDKQGESLDTAMAISERVERHLNESQSILSSVERRLDQLLQSDNCNITTGNLPGLDAKKPDTDLTLPNNTEAASDPPSLKCCERLAPAGPSFPYPVIQPSKESDLDIPYMCDLATEMGGWIIIQRRSTGQEDFYRDWDTYKTGFGSLSGDFWIGNDNLHTLTSSGHFELRVVLTYKGETKFANYDRFFVDSEANKYKLTVSGYSGTAGGSLSYHNGRMFSTFDQDNDGYDSRNCAMYRSGAWWHGICGLSNLNGKWGARSNKGPFWSAFTGGDPATFTEMKVRAVDKS